MNEKENKSRETTEPDAGENTSDRAASDGDRRQKKTPFLRLGAVILCLCVLIGAVLVPILCRRGESEQDGGAEPEQTEPPLPELPVWENPHYSAEELAAVFSTTGGASLDDPKVYAPNGLLHFIPVPAAGELGIYRYQDLGGNDQAELEAFAARFLPGIAAALGIETPEYEIVKNMLGQKGYELVCKNDDYLIDLTQRGDAQSVSLEHWRGAEGEVLYLGGTAVQIDQRQTDEEILSSLAEVRESLSRMFGVSFPDAKIVRSYGGVGKYGAEWVHIYFCEESAHALNALSVVPISDYIGLSFRNVRQSPGDQVSDSVLTNVTVTYKENRSAPEEECLRTDSVRQISVREAEALLFRGYVFGRHACPICMREGRPVSFAQYDFVGLEYVFQTDSREGRATVGMPFYVFYKETGVSDNGNLTYAKAYVPAIEISGCVEYFENNRKITIPRGRPECYPHHYGGAGTVRLK